MSTAVHPMDFKKATDELTKTVTADEIAEATGHSRATISRARLDPSMSAYRSPPPNWREAVIRLAEERIARLRQLVAELRK